MLEGFARFAVEPEKQGMGPVGRVRLARTRPLGLIIFHGPYGVLLESYPARLTTPLARMLNVGCLGIHSDFKLHVSFSFSHTRARGPPIGGKSSLPVA